MLSVIIPTYNEKESIIRTIKEAQKSIPRNSKYEVIVVDDDSPDKTWKAVSEYKDKRVKCVRRRKEKGLGSAVLRGFREAKGKYFLVMDADGQHDPSIIPRMLKYIEKNDFVIGSRFVKGGSAKNWSKTRLLYSKLAAMPAKSILDEKVHDPMSGFFMIQRRVYEENKEDITGKGFKIMLELMVFSEKKRRIKAKEVPYAFRPRREGASKLGIKTLVDYGLMLASLAVKGRVLKFVLTGLLGVLVNLGVLYALTEYAGLYYIVSAVIAIEIAILHNFLWNNYWTWRYRKKEQGFVKRLLSFNTVALAGMVINIAALWFFTEIIGLWYLLSQAIGIAIGALLNYFWNDMWTFKSK